MHVSLGLLSCTFPFSSSGTIFSRQIHCDSKIPNNDSSPTTCRDVLSGVVHLDSEEAFEFETLHIQDLAPDVNKEEFYPSLDAFKDVTILLKVEKSPLLLVYDLEFRKMVAGGVAEEVYDYTWSAATGSGVFEREDFEPHKCMSNFSTYFHEVEDSMSHEAVRELVEGGRVCGCVETGWGSSRYSTVKRSQLNCNAWPAVFRPGATVWASRHCPRLLRLTYAIYNLRGWRWDFQIKVTLEWMARRPTVESTTGASMGKMTRDFYLNWTSPEAYDKEFDFRFRILFSAPRSGSQPPDLSDRYHLLVPSNNAYLPNPVDLALPGRLKSSDFLAPGEPIAVQPQSDVTARLPQSIRRLEASRNRSLLVPSSMVDLTGKSCDKIGVSLFTWAAETGASEDRHSKSSSWVATDTFCAQLAASCTRNQPNDLYEADLSKIRKQSKPIFLLSEASLPDWSTEPPLLLSDIPNLLISDQKLTEELSTASLDWHPLLPRHLAWPTNVGHSTSLEVILNATEIAWMAGSPQGAIEDILLHPVDPTSEAQIIGVVRNKDLFAGRFSLGSAPCIEQHANDTDDTQPLDVAPVSKTIEPNHAELFVLNLLRLVGFEEQRYDCEIRLYDAKGSLIDKRLLGVTFGKREEVLANHEKPFFSAAKIAHMEVNERPNSTLGGGWFFDGLNRSFREMQPHAMVRDFSWQEATCPCALANLWCILTNFSGCTRRLRQILFTFLGLLLALGIAVLCGPTVICLLFRVCGWSCRFVRKRWRSTKQTIRRSTQKEDGSCGFDDRGKYSLPISGATTARTPPADREVISSKEPNHDGLPSNKVDMGNIVATSQHAVPPTPYLPPFFWGMPVPLAAAIFRSKFQESNHWKNGIDWKAAEEFFIGQGVVDYDACSNEVIAGRLSSEDLKAGCRPPSRGPHHTTPRHKPVPVTGSIRPTSSKSARGREVACRTPLASENKGDTGDAADSDIQASWRGLPRYFCWSPPRRREKPKKYYPTLSQATLRTHRGRPILTANVKPFKGSRRDACAARRRELNARNMRHLTTYSSVGSSAEDERWTRNPRSRCNVDLNAYSTATKQCVALTSNVRMSNISKKIVRHTVKQDLLKSDATSCRRNKSGPRLSSVTLSGNDIDSSPGQPKTGFRRRSLVPNFLVNARYHTDPGSSTEDSICR